MTPPLELAERLEAIIDALANEHLEEVGSDQDFADLREIALYIRAKEGEATALRAFVPTESMTTDAAQKVGQIIGTADSGCSTCVDRLIERLNAAFPAFVWTATGEDQPPEQPEWSDDPADASSPGLEVVAARNLHKDTEKG